MSNFTTQFSSSLIDTKMSDVAIKGDSQFSIKGDAGDNSESFARELSRANDQQRSADTRAKPDRQQRANAHVAGESPSDGQRATSQGNDEDAHVARATERVNEQDPSVVKEPGAKTQESLSQSYPTELGHFGIPTGIQTAQADDDSLTTNAAKEELVSVPADKLLGHEKASDAADVDSLAAIPDGGSLINSGNIDSKLLAQPQGKADAATLSTLQADTVSAGQMIGNSTLDASKGTGSEAPVDKLAAASINTASTGATGKSSVTANMDTIQGAELDNAQIKVQQQAVEPSTALNVAETASSSVTVNQLRQLSNNGGTKSSIPAGQSVVADEVVDTARTSTLTSVASIADSDVDGSAMREDGSRRTLDMSTVGQSNSGKTAEISASQLRVDQLTALSTQAVPDKSAEAASTDLVAGANAEILESDLPVGIKQVLKSGVQGEVALGLASVTSSVSSSSLPDNMLVDSSSGIVTAPLLTRTDAVSTQSVSTPLPVPIMSPAANEAMTSNINWMVKEGVQNASVNLMPAGMGPISVNIGIENEQMNVTIVATQSTTREALEALLPRLREQLLTQGHDSVRVDISDSKSDQSRGNNAQNQNPAYDRTNFGGEQSSDRNFDQSQGQANEQAQSGNERRSPEFGERPLTDAERERVASLQESMPLAGAGSTPIQHGYDLYV